MLRVTTLGTANSMLNYILNGESKYYELSEESASGLKVRKPSDDPSATKSLLNIDSQLSKSNGYLNNMTIAQNELNVLDDTMSSLTNLVEKATDLATEASNGTYSNKNMDDIKIQIDGIIQSAVDLANTQYDGTYIFSGTAAAKPYTINSGTGTITYNGTPSSGDYQRYTTISDGISVPINTTGDQVFGSYNSTTVVTDTVSGDVAGTTTAHSKDANGNAVTTVTNVTLNTTTGKTTTTTQVYTGFIGSLKQISNGLGNHDQAAVSTNLDGLTTALDVVSVNRTKFASVSNRFQITQDSIKMAIGQLKSYKTDLEDADLSQVLAELSSQQTSLQATYSITSQLMSGKSLMDYI